MKNLILFIFCSIFLMSCAKYSDGTSVWSGGLWILPIVTFIPACYFTYRSVLKSKSGSESQLPGGGYEDLKKNIPFYKQNLFKFAAALFVATIVIIIMVNRDK